MSYSFGNWIKTRRKALDLTQKELAELVGCSTSMIFKIESDQRRPSRQIAELIAEHLEIPADQLDLFMNIARQKKNITHLENLTALPDLELISEAKQVFRKLPVSPTPFVGREHEVSMITQQLLDPACRMLTLTGPGGIGKTRLAIEVGHQLKPQFSDGVVFISLAGVERVESIVPVIADSLGLIFSANAAPIAQVAAFLRKKNILLVVDNMEHLIEGREMLGEILQGTKHIKIILTSREHLNLQWEWLFEIQGLPIPERISENIEHNSAVNLFVQRARQTSHDFSLKEDNAESVVRICQLVDGSPLALELAASWVRLLSCQEIAQELEHNLDILETSKPDVPLRHRSIKSVFDHSWKLLKEEDRALLMKLSVFQGSFTREAAVAVADASLSGLSSLVNKSLLRHSNDRERYDLHELIRQYSFNKLHANPVEEAKTSEKHALYYANWLSELEDSLKSAKQTQTSKRIRSESSNWLASFHWVVENQRLEVLRKMSPCLNWYFEVHGYFDDALVIIKAALDKFISLGAPDQLESAIEKTTFASLLNQVGWFEFRKGNVEEGSALFSESLRIAQEYDDPEILFYIHVNWGYLSNLTGNFSEAKRLTSESLKYSEHLTPWHIAVSYSVLGIAAYNLGNLAEAYQTLTKSMEIWQSVGDPRGQCYCYLHLALVTFALNEISETESILRESNQIAAANEDWWSYAFGLDILGMVSLSQGKNEDALAYFEQSKARMREIGDRFALLHIVVHIGQAYAALGSYGDAKQLFLEVYTEAHRAKWTPIILNVLVSFVKIEDQLPAETKLAVALSVLSHPGIDPILHNYGKRIRDENQNGLTPSQIALAEKLALEKPAEEWAEEFLDSSAKPY